jgi:hypothetical protein
LTGIPANVVGFAGKWARLASLMTSVAPANGLFDTLFSEALTIDLLCREQHTGILSIIAIHK